MSSVAVHNNLSTFINAVAMGDRRVIEQAAHEVISQAEDASELIGQIGLLAMDGDSDGHIVLTLGAASAIARWLIALRNVLGEETDGLATGIPLVVQALTSATPAVKAGQQAARDYPNATFPSDLSIGETVSSALRKAIDGRDTGTVERLLFGLYGTGADYRTISIRIYDGIAQTFQEDGHALLCAVRGSQVLDAVEWGEDAPHYIHWLTPHLVRQKEEPNWVNVVHSFLSEEQHSLASYRTRLAAPQNSSALPLRALLLSDAATPQVCQGVFEALIKNGASAHGVASVIALSASDLLQKIGDERGELFVRVAHGLLCASATHLVYTQVQEVEALPLLFITAASINSLYKELGDQASQGKAARPVSAGGGLIAPSLLTALYERLEAQDIAGAIAVSRRYIQLGHDARALFAMIGLGAARVDVTADQGHALQIVQAAGDAYLTWPVDLAGTNIEGFLQIALRAAAIGTGTVH